MTRSLEEIFSILKDGVPEEDDPAEETPAPVSVTAPVEGEWSATIPPGALPYLEPCFCLRAVVAAEGGCILHHFRHHVRFILFED
jgi:hypothetical protein